MKEISRDEFVEEMYPLIMTKIPEIVRHASQIKEQDKETWVKAGLWRSEEVSNLSALLNPLHSQHKTLEQIKEQSLDHFSKFLLPRLNSITGTDSAKMTAHITGEPTAFGGNMKTLVQEKLMMINPLYRDGNLKRGTRLEFLGRDFAIEDGYIPRPDLAQKIKDNVQSHPYFDGTPDEVLEKNLRNGESRLILADYKVPNIAKGVVLHDYSMQIHHYLLCSLLGNKQNPDNQVNIDEMMLYEVSLNGFKGIQTLIPFDERILMNILEQGEITHNHIMNGTLPEIEVTNKFESLSVPAFMASKIAELNTVSEAKNLLQDKEDGLKLTLTESMNNLVPNSVAMMEHEGVVLKTDVYPVFSEDARRDYVNKFGIETDSMTNYKIDQAISKKALENDVTLEVPVTQKTKILFSRKKVHKEEREERIAGLVTPINAILEKPKNQELVFLEEMDEMDQALRGQAPLSVDKSSSEFVATPPPVSHVDEKKSDNGMAFSI